MLAYGNAIQRVMSESSYKGKIGKRDARILRRRMVKAHPLSNSESPIPMWALDLLTDKTIDATTRIKIVCTHHFDITGFNGRRGFVPMSSAMTSPKKDSPSALASMRDARLKIAKEYIQRLERKENENADIQG